MVHFLYKTNVVLLVGFCEISMSCFVNCHNSTTPQPWYWAFIANTSRFCGHTKSYLARRFSEIIWKHLKLSDDFRRILKTSENKWIYLKIFWWFSENKWNYLKLSDDFRHCLKLPHLRREPSVFFSQKKTTRRNVIARGFGGLAPPSAMTKINFCWCYSPTKLKLVMADIRIKIRKSEVGKLTNWNW